MQQIDTLIRTKIRLPYIRPQLVNRPQLQARVTDGIRGPLTLVIAPAGFGKTTILAASIFKCCSKSAWLSLDRDDNREGRFLSYLIGAIKRVDSTVGDAASQLLSNFQQPVSESVITSLINDLESYGEPIVLVLDDYHFIHNSAIHSAITFLIEHAPANFHLVIVSRSDPPLPIARLRARGQAVELRADDLRFQPAEAAQFLNEIMGLELDQRSISMLEARTEGWIAGLQMAALSIRDRPNANRFIEGFSGTNRFILDYLLEEVLSSQPSDIQHFLQCTSILDRMTASLCDAVLDLDTSDRVELGFSPVETRANRSSAMILDYLERENLFLSSLDDERAWFRYHHLFADLLKSRLHQEHPEVETQLHLRAATWLENRSEIPAAIQHLMAANEMDRAADLIDEYGPRQLASGDPTILQMAEAISQKLILARPRIAIYQAWFHIIHSRIPEARPLLLALRQEFSQEDDIPNQRWMRTIVDTALAFLTPPGLLKGNNLLPDPALLEEIPESEIMLRNTAEILYGMTLARMGKLDLAVNFSENQIKRNPVTINRHQIPSLAPFLTRLYLMQGRLSECAALCHAYLDPGKGAEIGLAYTSGSMKIDLGEVFLERNLLDTAEGLIREGLRENEPWQNIMTDGFGLIALIRVLRAKGEFSAVMKTVDQLEARLCQHAQPREFDESMATIRVSMQLASGNINESSLWAEKIEQSEEYKQHKERYITALARIRLAQGKFKEGIELLDEMIPSFSPGSITACLIDKHLLMAACLAGQKRVHDALNQLDASFTLAEPEGYIRVFLDQGRIIFDLLKEYLNSEVFTHQPFARTIFIAGSQSNPTEAYALDAVKGHEILSRRESEVLQLLASGKTNLEIASQLFISPGTVKAHTASIYRKLNAANRTEAVAHGREYGLLQ